MMLPRLRISSGATCVSQKRERLRRKNVSLIKRGNVWHFAFRWNGKRYRGSCKTSKQQEANKVESLVLARLLEDGRAPGNKKIPTLADFSNRFFNWLEALPANRPPKAPTRKYYRVGWRMLESTPIAGMKLDHITTDQASIIEGSSAANTNNALRTLRRMLKKAHEWQLLSMVPVVKLVEEYGREELMEPWMEQSVAKGHGGRAPYGERPKVACRLGAVPNGPVNHAGFWSSPWRDLPDALGEHSLGQRVDLQPPRQVPQIPALRSADRARQDGTPDAQGRRKRRMGFPVKDGSSRSYHRPRGFQAVAGSQTVGRYSRSGRPVLCSPSFLNRRDGGHWERDGGHGCDGASVSQYHAHLQPLECDADSGSNRAQESTVVRDGAIGWPQNWPQSRYEAVFRNGVSDCSSNGSATGNRTR